MSSFEAYPKDPLTPKQMEDFTTACVASEKAYKQYSDKLVSSCGVNSSTSLKSQKACIDKIKEVIKAPSKKHPPIQKFYSLKLLNKCVLKKNPDLNLYIEQKVTQRLSILAEFNNDPNEKSAQALLTRGKHIFGPDEKDTQNSANFLIILLDCIEKWALTFQFEDGELDDTKSSKSKMSTNTQSGEKFYKVYTKLLEKGVKFPSTFKQDKQGSGRKSTISSNQPQNEDSYSARLGSKSPNRVTRNKTVKDDKSERSRSPFQPQSQPISLTSRSMVPDDQQSTSSTLTQEKKAIINNLKKKMQKVKEASKNAQKFNDKMSLPGSDEIMADAVELITLRDLFTESKNNCEDSINQLMSDEVSPHISNSEKLLEKMFGYQEILNKALTLMNKQIDQQSQIEQQVLSASKADPKKETNKPDIPLSLNEDNDVIQPRNIEKPKKQDSVSKEEAKSKDKDNSKAEKKPAQENKAVEEVNQIMQDNKTNFDQTTVVDSMQHQHNQLDFQGFDFKNKDLSQVDQPISARQVLQTNQQAPNPYEFEDFGQQKEMFQTHVQPEGQNAFGMGGNDDQWFTTASQQQPPQTDFNFNFDQPADQFEFSSAPKESKQQSNVEEEEKVPDVKKNFEEKLEDNDGLRVVEGSDQISNNEFIENDENKKQLTFASSPSRKNTFGKLSDINQSKPVGSESKVDLTFNDDNSREQSPEAKSKNDDGGQQDFFQFDNPPEATKQVTQANKPAADDFGFEFDDGGAVQKTQENQDPSQLFNFESNQDKSTGRFENMSQKSDLGIDLANLPKSPKDLNETGQFGFNADTFRKQEDVSDEEQKEVLPPSQKLKSQPQTGKFADSKKLEDEPSLQEENSKIQTTQQSQIKQTASVVQPGNKEDEEDISSGISGKSNLKEEKKMPQNVIENDKFEEEFVPQAKSALDESILEPDSQDIEVQKKIQSLKQILKTEESCKRWWSANSEIPGADASEQVSFFANNILPQQLQPMNEIKSQLEDMQEYQQEILKLKGENKKLVDEQGSAKEQYSKYEQNIMDLNDEIEGLKKQMDELKSAHTHELEAKDQILKQTNLELDLEKEQQQKLIASQKEELAKALKQQEEQLEEKDMKIEELLDKVTKQMQSYDDLEQKYKVEMQEQQAVISSLRAEIEMMEMPKPANVPELQVPVKKEEVDIDFNQLLPNKQGSNEKEQPTKQNEVQNELQSPPKEIQNVLASPDSTNFVFSPEQSSSNQKQDSLMQNLNFGQLLSENTEPETHKQEPTNSNIDFKDFTMPQAEPNKKEATNNLNGFNFADLGIPTDSKVFEEKKDEEQKLNSSRSASKIPVKPNLFADKGSSRASIDTSSSKIKPQENKSLDQPKVEAVVASQEEEQKLNEDVLKSNSSVDINAFAQNQLSNLMGEPLRIQPNKSEPVLQSQDEKENDKTLEEIKPQVSRADTSINAEQKSDQLSSLPLQMTKPQESPQIEVPAQQDNSRKSNPFEVPTPKQMLSQAKEEAPQQSQQKMMQALQQDLLRQKLASFHINSLLQGSKCVIYEDVNVKIGCIRKCTFNSGQLKAEIKIFLRNHNQAKMNINNIDIKFECANQGANSTLIKVLRSSQPLPLQSPPSQPLVQNQTLDMDIEIQWPPSYQTGFRSFFFDNFKLVLQYELENKRRSGFLPIALPFNILNMLSPYQTMNAAQFRELWQQIQIDSGILAQKVQEERSFQLDLQKAQNMAKLKQIISLNNTCFAIVPQVEAQPNWVCFACMVPDQSQQSQQTLILVKIMLTKDGKECSAQLRACRDTHSVSLQVLDTILAMISKQ